MSTNNRYVIDSWAWIEYLDGSEIGKRVDKILGSKSEIYTNGVTLAEVISRAKRTGRSVETSLQAILSLSKVVLPDEKLATEAGLVHAEIKSRNTNFSLADAFALQTAKSLNAKVLTGDPDFEGIKEAVILKKE